MKVRNLLIEIRKKKNLTIRQAAKGIGISYPALNKIENCEYDGSIIVWKKIQKFYDIKLKDVWSYMTTYKYVENPKKSK